MSTTKKRILFDISRRGSSVTVKSTDSEANSIQYLVVFNDMEIVETIGTFNGSFFWRIDFKEGLVKKGYERIKDFITNEFYDYTYYKTEILESSEIVVGSKK